MVLVILLVGAVIVLPVNAGEKLKFAMPGKGLSYFPLVIAERRGFLKERGIEAEIAVATPNVAISGMMSGDVDFVGSAIGVLAAGIRGLPVKLVYLFAFPQHSLVVKESQRFTSIRSLVGKPIAVSTTGTAPHFLVVEAFERTGLNPKRDLVVHIARDPTAMYAALAQGIVSAAVLDLAGTIVAEREGYTILERFAGTVPLPLSGLGMTSGAFEKQKDLVDKVVEAMRRGSVIINDPKARGEVIQMVVKWSGFTSEQARRALDLAEGSFTKEGKIGQLAISTTNKFLRYQFPERKDIDISKFIHSSVIEE